MIRNEIWGFFYLPDPHNKDKKWDILLHKSRFPLGCVKCHIKILQKGSKLDKYMVQNLSLSVAYLKITLSYALIQKVLKILSMEVTVPEVYVTTMITVLYGSYASLVDTMNQTNSLRLKDILGKNVTD